ncbi:MAG: TIR domain-containing protein [Cyanobacteria bacterium P01_G01_bin.38]
MLDTQTRTNPFPGLRPFEASETHLFFGREGQIDELLRRLRKHRFLAVTGTSGSGKSSLVRAGLLPALYSGSMVQAGANWRIALMRPTNSPIANLARALNDPEVLGSTGEDARLQTLLTDAVLRRGALGLAEAVEQAQMPQGENLLVVVDQFEELFRFRNQPGAIDEATAFVKLLLEATSQVKFPIYVVLTMRSDFLGECVQFRGLPEALNDSQYLIPRLTRDQLTSAIKGPVAVRGAKITPRLVNRLLNDTEEDLNQLPILQHALSQTWADWEIKNSSEVTIDIEHYEAIGTTDEALSNHADKIFNKLKNKSDKEIAKLIFQIITVKVDNRRYVRRPTSFRVLESIIKGIFEKRRKIQEYQKREGIPREVDSKPYKEEDVSNSIISVLNEFRDESVSFVMPPPSRKISNESIIDISHEVIVYAWRKLKDWIKEESQNSDEYIWICKTTERCRKDKDRILEDSRQAQQIIDWVFESNFCKPWSNLYNDKFESTSSFINDNYLARKGQEGFEYGELVGIVLNIKKKLVISSKKEAIEDSLTEASSGSLKDFQEAESRVGNYDFVGAKLGRSSIRLCFQIPREDRIRRVAISRPRDNDIFIAYAPEDSNFVRRIDRAIRAEGLDPWIDFDDIPSFGQSESNSYQSLYREGLFKADTFILILSSNTYKYEAIIESLRMACRLNKIICLVLKDIQLDLLALSDVLDRLVYFDIQSAPWDKVFKRVAQNIIHLQTYVRLLARSTEWDKKGRPPQYLITAEDFREVKKQIRWIDTHKLGRQFQFTEVQQAFLEAVEAAHTVSGALEEKSVYGGQGLPDIFVCYSHANRQFVHELSQRLRQEGWQLWLDQDTIPVATDWRDESDEGIRQAHTFFFIVDPESVQSAPCLWELERARYHNKRIIPIISKKGYSQAALDSIGLSSIQYISFIREQSTFEQTLSELLDVLKLNLGDLKTYRRLLVKAYEWAEQERQDRFLMNRHDYQEIQHWRKQRQHLDSKGNWDIEPLIARQQEYIWASQRYLALQRKRQGLYASVILATVFGLTGLLLITSLGEVKALVTSLDDRKGLDALVVALQASKRVKQNDFFVQRLRPSLRAETINNLYRATVNLKEINRLEGHIGKVFSVVFSPDGQQLVSGGVDQSVRFWELNQNLTEVAFAHSGAVETIAYSSDNQWIATGDRDGLVKLWQQDGALYKTLPKANNDKINQVAFSPGNQFLASVSSDGSALIWHQENGFRTPTLLKHDAPVISLAFNRSGNQLVTADSQGKLKLWQISGELISSFEYGSPVYKVEFNPRKDLVAIAGKSPLIQIWNPVASSSYVLKGHEGSVYDLAFNSNGDQLASASEDYTVRLWQIKNDSGILSQTLRGHQGPVHRVAFRPTGNMLASAGKDPNIRIWSSNGGSLIDVLDTSAEEILDIDFSPTAPILASAGSDGIVRIWRVGNYIQPPLEAYEDEDLDGLLRAGCDSARPFLNSSSNVNSASENDPNLTPEQRERVQEILEVQKFCSRFES